MNWPAQPLQLTHSETQRLPQELREHIRHCLDELGSRSVSVAFVYISSLQMATSLPNLAIVEERTVIRCLCSEGFKTSTIYRKMLTQYGERCMAKKSVYGRVDRFKRGRTTLNDEKPPGWPSKSLTDDHRVEVEALIKENKQNAASEIALAVDIS